MSLFAGRFRAAAPASADDDGDGADAAAPAGQPPPPMEDQPFHDATTPFYHHGHASSATSGELLVDARGSGGAINSPDSGGGGIGGGGGGGHASTSSASPSSTERPSIGAAGAGAAATATGQQAYHRTRATVAFAGLPPEQHQPPMPPPAPLPPPPQLSTPFHLHPPAHGPHPSVLPGLLRTSAGAGAASTAAPTPSLSSAPSMSKLRRHHGGGKAAAAAAAAAAAGLFGGGPHHPQHHPKPAFLFFTRWRRILARAPLGVRALAALAAGALLLVLVLLLSPEDRPTTTAAAGRGGTATTNDHHHRAATRLLESAGLAAAHAAHAAARAAARAARAGSRAAHAAHARAAFAGGGNTLADPFFYASAPVLVSYAYFEKDARQRANFEYFLAAGTGDLPSPDQVAGGAGSASAAAASWWRGGGSNRGRRRGGGGSSSSSSSAPEIHFAIAVAGDACSPCAALDALLPPPEPPSEELDALGIASARSSGGDGSRFTLVKRARNEGLDLASHNATLSFLALRGRLHRYRFFFLINSSAMGPFIPSWLPPGWHWTHAFTARLGTADAERARALALAAGAEGGDATPTPPTTPTPTTTTTPPDTRPSPPRTVAPSRPLRAVRAVGSSLVCLPEHDAGGPGPRLESWALALDELGLASAVRAGALAMRSCKTCPDAETSVVVGGEYALTKALLDEGHNVATLLARYARGVDWSDPAHARCNDNGHPSRVGSYAGGLSTHPFETVFVKSSWHVASAYTSRYSSWKLAHLLGRAGTEGRLDAVLYRWGVSEEGTTGAAALAAEVERAYGGAAARARVVFGGEHAEKEAAEAAKRAEVARQARRAIGIEEEEEEEGGGA